MSGAAGVTDLLDTDDVIARAVVPMHFKSVRLAVSLLEARKYRAWSGGRVPLSRGVGFQHARERNSAAWIGRLPEELVGLCSLG